MTDLHLLELGGFTLAEPLRRGPHDRVWGASHRDGLDAWLWVQGSRSARRPEVAGAYLDTWRQVARLEHPAVVPPLAVGLVPEDPVLQANGLLAGAPWVATPAPRSGSLADVVSGTRRSWDDETAAAIRWPVARALLLRCLEALSRAHAAGVLHLDLRPENLLLDVNTGAPTPRRTDALQLLSLAGWAAARPLGAGRAPGSDASLRLVTGLPGRMPPEQVDGDWRRYGPWTDLYALGVLGWELVTGELPFSGDNRRAVLFRQLQGGPGPFRPRFPAPSELEGWLRVTLSAEPARRFSCAADARRSLLALGDAVQPDEVATLDTPTLRIDEARVELLITGRPPPDTTFPVPRTRREQWSRAALTAGRSLRALRPSHALTYPQLRARLWARLQAAHRTGRGRAVALVGPAERGGASLVRWLGRAAHEAGLSLHLIHVRCGAGPARDRGVVPALGRVLGAEGLHGEALEAALARRLTELGDPDPWLARALTGLLSAGHAPAQRTPSPTLVAASVVAVLARHRPVVMWLEDAEDDAESREIAAHLVQRQAADPSRLLLVSTVASPPGDDGEREIVELPELSTVEARRMLQAEGVAQSADARWWAVAGAAPALLSLVAAAARRGEAPPDGDPLEAARLVARRRAEAALRPLGADGVEAACQGAILGQVWAEPDWRELSGSAVATVAEALVEAGILRPLASAGVPGWRLRWPLARQALLDLARDTGRLRALHRRMATLIEAQRPEGGALLVDLAWHRLMAGDASGAWSAAARATRAWQEAGRPWRAREAAWLAAQALGQTGAKRGRRVDELRLLEAEVALAVGDAEGALAALARAGAFEAPDLATRAACLRGEASAAVGETAQARAALTEARLDAQAHGLVADFVRASFSLAELVLQQGAPSRAVPLLRDVLALPPVDGDAGLPARARVALAAAARAAGDLVEAGAQLRQALREADALDDPSLTAQVRCEQARVHRLRGRHHEAAKALDQGLDLARRVGAPQLLADVWAERGALLRQTGDLDEAERALARATAWAQTAARSHTLSLIRLGRLRSARGDHDGAREALNAALDRCTRLGEPVWIPLCKAALVEVAAGLRDWVVFDLGRSELARVSWSGVAFLPEVADPLEQAGARAWAVGQLDRARAALDLAARLWEEAGDLQRATRLRRRLEGVEDAPTEEAPRWLRDDP